MKGLKTLAVTAVVAAGLSAAAPVVHADKMMMDDNMKGKAMMMGETMKGDVAVSGYCPVCVIHGKLSKGSDNFTTEYKGKVYKFPDMDKQKMFLENPEEYTKDLQTKFEQLKDKT